jgi:hypothetical protein
VRPVGVVIGLCTFEATGEIVVGDGGDVEKVSGGDEELTIVHDLHCDVVAVA